MIFKNKKELVEKIQHGLKTPRYVIIDESASGHCCFSQI